MSRKVIPSWRRWTILFVVCWTALPVTFASNALFAATTSVAHDLDTTANVIRTINAAVIVGMSLSHFVWGPITALLGRKKAYVLALLLQTGCNIGMALSKHLATLGTCWILAGTTGTFFLITGQVIISDIFEPTNRGTAVGFFLGTCVASNGLAPMTGGLIVSFTTWRVIFWVQFSMACFALILAIIFIPVQLRVDEEGYEIEQVESKRPVDLAATLNPIEVLRQMKHPTVLMSNFACALLALNQYALLSSIPASINPRFNLTTPLISGLFYLAPGCGFLVGSTVGGRLSDRTVKRWIAKRDGVRLPFDRLRASLGSMFLLLPISELVYSWTLQKKVGGFAAPIVSAFMIGVGLMSSFSALNTFAAEVIPERKAQVIGSKYFIQYLFAAGGTASASLAIQHIGVGWTFTIAASGSVIAGLLVWIIIKFGQQIHGCVVDSTMQ